MDNHYHLLLETPDANLSAGMRRLNGMYTQAHNRRHKKSGHVFQGRFKAILVDKENYLLELCRYVVLNPVRASVVREAGNWPWSSFRATAGLQPAPDYLSVDWILALFGVERKDAQERYQAFVLEGMHTTSPWPELQGQVILAKEGFVEKFKDLLADKELIKEIPRSQRYASRPGLDKLFSGNDSRAERDCAIYDAHVKYGYTLKEIGEHLGIHYTTVSKAVSRSEAE